MLRLSDPRQIVHLTRLADLYTVRGSAYYSVPACWLDQSRSAHNTALCSISCRPVLRRRKHAQVG